MSMFRYQNVNSSQELLLYLAGVRHPGTYQLKEEIDPFVISGPSPSHGYYRIISGARDFYTGPKANGQVTITRLDTVARIVAGTFEAKLKEDGGPDSLNITQGRFDFKF